MKLIIEDYPYKAESVEQILQGVEALRSKDGLVRVSYVGYCYNNAIKDCVFFLPKVIIDEASPARVLGKYLPEDIINVSEGRMEKADRDFIYGLSAWIYRAVREYQRLNDSSEIVYENTFSRMDGSNSKVSNTLIDIILSIIDFNRREKDFFMFNVRNIHSGHNRINWNKTISKEQAYIRNGRPVYLDLINRRKEINYDEELIVIFYSILNYIQQTYGFKTSVNFNYDLITGSQFRRYLQHFGKQRLRQIKYRYFSDRDVMMWKLCYAFFDLSEIISSTRQENDYLLVKNFNIVFEAMIDELLSEKELKTSELADQPDGKIVDHIFPYEGVMNNGEQIYYIGDSKYYKIENVPGKRSVYKQYTYARNVIQHNMGLFLEHPERAGQDYLIYRDEATEGYNITPNFFISGLLSKERSYKDAELVYRRDEEPVMHFKNRLFDRDTLLLQHYDINFLFVLSLYGGANEGAKETFRSDARETFRKHFIKYLEGRYQFFSLQQKTDKSGGINQSISRHFREIIGKTFRPYNDQDILYLSFDRRNEFAEDNLKLLEELSNDFLIRSYKLGTDPRAQINHFIELTSAAGAGRAQTQVPVPAFRFEDFGEEVFLVGGYRSKDKNQYDWIMQNALYNIRDHDLRTKKYNGRNGAMARIDPNVVSARYLILYNIDEESHTDYTIHEIVSHRQMSQKEMEQLGYDSPNGKYIVYSIKKTPVTFQRLKLDSLMKELWVKEVETRRQEQSGTRGWEDRWKGTPCFVTGSEIARHAAE